MDEHEKLLDPNNYKILIQLKKNRRKRLKTRYLTSDFIFSEDINDALVFDNFQEAEEALAKLNFQTSKPRIFIKYIEEMENEKWESEKD